MATFTNKATLSYNGITVDSNTVVGTFLETLSISKTALVDSYADGSSVSYAVSLINSGATAFSGVTVTDNLGEFSAGGLTLYPLSYVDGSLLYYIDGVLQPTPATTAASTLTVSGLSIPAGSNAMLLYTAEVTEYAPLGINGSITNTVSAEGAGIVEALTASEVVNTADAPRLSISKALSPTSVAENGVITYTFVIQNYGNTEAVATDNIVVRDIFDPILNVTSVTLDGAPLAEGVGYTYDEATGEFETVQSVITVPAATFRRLADGRVEATPGEVTLVVVGSI